MQVDGVSMRLCTTTIQRVMLPAALLLLGFLSACAAPTPAPPPPEEIIAKAAERMKAVGSFRFAIDRDGAFAYLNPERTLAFARAEGDYVAPDQAQAKIRVIAPGIVAEVQMASRGERYWETDFINGEWQELPSGSGFNPASLFDPQGGFQDILRQDVRDLKLEGVEELDDLPGQPLYALSGALDGGRLYDLTYGLIGPAESRLHLWILPETYELLRILIDEPLPAGEIGEDGETSTRWQIDFWDFDQLDEIPVPGN